MVESMEFQLELKMAHLKETHLVVDLVLEMVQLKVIQLESYLAIMLEIELALL